jgi:hypothetical protein
VRRGLLLALTVLIALAVAPAASATKPVRDIIPGQKDVVIDDQCAFPVLAHVEGREIVTTFLDKEGNPVKQIGIFPGNTLTLTNVETDRSVTVVATGPYHARVEPDGSGSVLITGHGPFLPNPVTGEPGIWYLTGRVRATFDAQGNVTSVDARGTLVDLCVQLAS